MTRQQGPQGSAIISQFLVSSSASEGYFTTIQEAINAAQTAGGGTVCIKAGIYTEDLVFTNGTVDLVAIPPIVGAEVVQIVGTHTPPTTGSLTIKGIQLSDAASVISSVAAGTSAISLLECDVTITNGTAINLPNWTGAGVVYLYDVSELNSSTDGGLNVGDCLVLVYQSTIGSGLGAMSLTGNVTFFSSVIGCALTISSNATFIAVSCYTSSITMTGTSTAKIATSTMATSPSPAIVMSSSGSLELTTCDISGGATCISGAGLGSVIMSDVVFLNDSSIASTLTLAYPTTYVASPEFRQATTLRGVTGFSGSQSITAQAAVQTGDASSTPIAGVVVNENESITLQGTIVGAQSDHSNAVGGSFTITARRAAAGNVTLIGVVVTNVQSSTAATFTCDVDVPSQSVRILVQGVAATTYNWVATYSYGKVLTNT